MRYLVAAVVAMATFAGPARALDMDNGNKTPTQLYFERQEKERAENEKAYNTQMKRLKGQNPTDVKRDPWSSVRPADSAAKR